MINLGPTTFSLPYFWDLSTRSGLQAAADDAVCLAVRNPRFTSFAVATAAMAEIETRIGYDGQGPLLAYQNYLRTLDASDIPSSMPSRGDFPGDVLEALAVGMNDHEGWNALHWRKAVQGVIEAGGLADLTLAAERAFGLASPENESRALEHLRRLEERLSFLEDQPLSLLAFTPRARHEVRKRWSSPSTSSKRFLEMIHAVQILNHAVYENDANTRVTAKAGVTLTETLIDEMDSDVSLTLLSAHLLLAFGLATYFDFSLEREPLLMPLKLGLVYHAREGLSSPKDWAGKYDADASLESNEDILYIVHLLKAGMPSGKLESLLSGATRVYPELKVSR